MSFFSEEVRRNPFPTYQKFRQRAPVLYDPKANLWMLFRYDAVKWALTDHDTFSSEVSTAGVTARWLVFLDPPRHTQLRRLVAQAFAPAVVKNLEERIRSLSAQLLQGVRKHGEFDLVRDYAMPLPLMVIAELLGAPPADYPLFRRWSDLILGLVHSVSADADGASAVQEYRRCTEEMRAYLRELLNVQRHAGTEQILPMLSEVAVEGQRLEFEDILAFFQLLLLAGHETTANLICNALLSLHEHPEQLTRLRAAPALLGSAIEEVLRFRSPVQSAFRITRKPVRIEDRDIPPQSLVLPLIGSANHDPDRFADPEHFDIARDPNPHIAFGHGAHFCLGAALARLEAKLVLPDLLSSGLEIETETWRPRDAFHVHGPAALPARFR